MNEYMEQAKAAWAKNGPMIAAIIILVVVILLIIAIWFIWDASNEIGNLYWWLPIILILLVLVDFRLFLFSAVLLIIFSLWLNFSHHRDKQDRQLQYGCDYEQKLKACHPPKKPCDRSSRSKSKSKSDKYHSD